MLYIELNFDYLWYIKLFHSRWRNVENRIIKDSWTDLPIFSICNESVSVNK